MATFERKHLTGLLGSAGKAIANAPRGAAHIKELRQIQTPQEFRDFLQTVDLGVEPETAQGIIDEATRPDTWREAHGTLLHSADLQRADSMDANA